MKSWQLWYCVPWSSDSCGIASPWSPDSCGIVSPWSPYGCGFVPPEFLQVVYCVPWNPDICGIVSQSWQLLYCVPWSSDSCGIVSPEILTAMVLCLLKFWQLWYCVPWSPESCGSVFPEVPKALHGGRWYKKYWNVRNANIGALSMLYSMLLVHQMLFLSTSFFLLPNRQYSKHG